MMKILSVLVVSVIVWSTPSKGIESSERSTFLRQPSKITSAADLTYDVVVYGGTSGGVMAAVAAKRYGQSVMLVTPGRRLGGMVSSGLGYTDVGDERTITGLAREFFRRIGYYYGKASRDSMASVLKAHSRGDWKYYKGVPDQPWNNGDGAGEGWTFEPHVAEQVFRSFIDEADIEVLYSRHVTKIKKQGTKIKRITLAYDGKGAGGGDLTVAAKVFIDASYEGDLMSRSGVSFTVGRENNKTFNERYNGVQLSKTKGVPGETHVVSEYPQGVDPYVKKGDPESGLLPGVQHKGLAQIGTGDDKVQAYNFRMTLCWGDRMQPLEKPDGYDADRYKLLTRMMQSSPWKNLHTGFTISPIPNGATDWNSKGGYGFSTDYIGGSYAWPTASYAKRDSIWTAHKRYQEGLMWFVGHDPSVPDSIRREMQQWGTCRGEFLSTGGWPPQLYVREARRMRGVYVITEHDLYGRRVVGDGIAFGSYPGDSHDVQRVVVDGKLENDGNILVGSFPTTPYPISYRAIIPRIGESSNLLVPFALSATHVAFGSIRMEPVFMVIGQSAGVAAAEAVQKKIPVQHVNVPALQSELHDNPLAGLPLPKKHQAMYRFNPNLGYAGDK